MKTKWISLDCHIAFKMKPGETNEDAEDRLLEVLDNARINLVSWKNEEIEEFDDAPD